MKNVISVITLILLLSGMLFGGTKYAGSFLELGVGARALAMGGTNVALSEDAFGAYWNPSGLAFLTNYQAAAMYASGFNQLEKHNFASIAVPIFGGATVGLSWIRLGIDDIPRYLDIRDPSVTFSTRQNDPDLQYNYEASGTFGSASNAYIITFAKYQKVFLDLGWNYFEFPIDFGYGLNFKILNEKIFENTGSGIGVDLGIILKIQLVDVFNDDAYGDLVFGLNAQDIAGTKITWDTDSKHKDEVERNFKYGVGFRQPLTFLNSQLTTGFDLDSRYSGSGHFGFEFLYDSMLAIRAGSNRNNFTAGAGIIFWKLSFDYAYQGHDLGESHRVSVLFNL